MSTQTKTKTRLFAFNASPSLLSLSQNHFPRTGRTYRQGSCRQGKGGSSCCWWRRHHSQLHFNHIHRQQLHCWIIGRRHDESANDDARLHDALHVSLAVDESVQLRAQSWIALLTGPSDEPCTADESNALRLALSPPEHARTGIIKWPWRLIRAVLRFEIMQMETLSLCTVLGCTLPFHFICIRQYINECTHALGSVFIAAVIEICLSEER